MTRRAAALLLIVVLVVVSACTTTRTAAPAPTAAKDGANVAACRDAVCEVRLAGRTVQSVAPATGITEVAVESIVDDAVTAAINSVVLSVPSAVDGVAILQLSR